MKRLYNEYSACPYEGKAADIANIANKAFKDIWNIVQEYDLCPRDTSLYCHEIFSALFAQEILWKAMKKKKEEKNTKFKSYKN